MLEEQMVHWGFGLGKMIAAGPEDSIQVSHGDFPLLAV